MQQLLSTYWVSGIALGTANILENKTKKKKKSLPCRV